jgi:hypothetical protein
MATLKLLEKTKKVRTQKNIPKNIEKWSSSTSIEVSKVFFSIFWWATVGSSSLHMSLIGYF